jgi:hypothetical protein
MFVVLLISFFQRRFFSLGLPSEARDCFRSSLIMNSLGNSESFPFQLQLDHCIAPIFVREHMPNATLKRIKTSQRPQNSSNKRFRNYTGLNSLRFCSDTADFVRCLSFLYRIPNPHIDSVFGISGVFLPFGPAIIF